jgi:hypothetical protein
MHHAYLAQGLLTAFALFQKSNQEYGEVDRSIRTMVSGAYVGKTATAPMYKNPPATKGITYNRVSS